MSDWVFPCWPINVCIDESPQVLVFPLIERSQGSCPEIGLTLPPEAEFGVSVQMCGGFGSGDGVDEPCEDLESDSAGIAAWCGVKLLRCQKPVEVFVKEAPLQLSFEHYCSGHFQGEHLDRR